MITLPLLIVAMTGIFLLGLFAQHVTKWRFCAVCIAVSSTWLMLLGMRLFGFVINPVLIGILMGESIVGVYVLLEKRGFQAWPFFRWPYILTMTVAVSLVLGIRSGMISAMILLTLFWFIAGGVYAFRRYPSMKKIAARLIACCRDW